MAWLDDLKTICIDAGVKSEDIILSSRGAVPTSTSDVFVSIVETGGTAPDRIQNVEGDAYENPSAQIVSRSKKYPEARQVLAAIKAKISVIENERVNGTWYVRIRPLQSILDLGLDANGRARVALNIMGMKEET